jgi:hypothetical protein
MTETVEKEHDITVEDIKYEGQQNEHAEGTVDGDKFVLWGAEGRGDGNLGKGIEWKESPGGDWGVAWVCAELTINGETQTGDGETRKLVAELVEAVNEYREEVPE